MYSPWLNENQDTVNQALQSYGYQPQPMRPAPTQAPAYQPQPMAQPQPQGSDVSVGDALKVADTASGIADDDDGKKKDGGNTTMSILGLAANLLGL